MLGTRTGHQSQNECKKGVREGTLGHHNPVMDLWDPGYGSYRSSHLSTFELAERTAWRSGRGTPETHVDLRRFHCIVQPQQNVTNVSFRLSFPSCTQWLQQLLSAGRKQGHHCCGNEVRFIHVFLCLPVTFKTACLAALTDTPTAQPLPPCLIVLLLAW